MASSRKPVFSKYFQLVKESRCFYSASLNPYRAFVASLHEKELRGITGKCSHTDGFCSSLWRSTTIAGCGGRGFVRAWQWHAAFRFDIGLLAHRLIEATRWMECQSDAKRLRIGYFGSSTGGAAALVADATLGPQIDAVVSQGGRPDLAGSSLNRVQSPTLLIVGGHDEEVLRINADALKQMTCEKVLKIVPKATHLFEEEGALPEVARPAAEWFQTHLKGDA